jgi:uncharacterized protein
MSLRRHLGMETPILSRIEIFPIKSLDGISLAQATVLPSGALQGDRQYAIVNDQGNFINGKSTPAVHKLRTTFTADLTTVTIGYGESSETFSLTGDRQDLAAWLSDYFEQSVTVQENTSTGFPDDLNAPGPTIISTATLEAITHWFPSLELAEVRRRFRTNLELSAPMPFWEERLYGASDTLVEFKVGTVQFMGVNPCQRCIVPARDSLTGERDPTFQRQFNQQRQSTLPDWAARSRFNHFYKLAVNTRVVANGEVAHIAVGDRVIGPRDSTN